MIGIQDRKLVLWNIGVAYIAFLIGTFADYFKFSSVMMHLNFPAWLDYYQILTAHGVLLALIYTTFFIFAFLIAGMSKTLGNFGPKVRLFAMDRIHRHYDWYSTCNDYDCLRQSFGTYTHFTRH